MEQEHFRCAVVETALKSTYFQCRCCKLYLKSLFKDPQQKIFVLIKTTILSSKTKRFVLGKYAVALLSFVQHCSSRLL